MKASTQRSLRKWHSYMGLFFAPAILFFSATGFLQVAGFAERGAPAWIAWAAGIHKHQQAPHPRPAPPKGQPGPGGPGGPGGHDEHGFVPLKPFAVFTAIALFVTSAMGIAIALANRASRRLSLLIIVAGVIVPVVLMLV